jgi:Ser/Thr protein kinase RdoA (MazF antagonist)
MNDIMRFMDEKGRIKTWASKKEIKYEILKYISTKFENGRFYTEKEINTVIEDWHTFGDYFLLRRGLIESLLLSRTKSGSRYWKEERDAYKDIIGLVEDNYDVGNLKSIFCISSGFGSYSYYILSDKGEYILKDIEQNSMNHPENEALILSELRNNGIPVSEIYPTKSGDYVLKLENKVYHLQKYIEGKAYSRNSAPQWLLYESANMLGKVQKAMEKLPLLPIGISQGFFDFMTPERARNNYSSTLEIAIQRNDTEIINAINTKYKMLDSFDGFIFDVSRMTCKNTHGDYKIHQIICGKDKINALIDLTSACVHPICWEIIRSYSLADNECIDGNINIDNFKRYISYFLENGSLNHYDLKIMSYVYYYQSLVSDYFRQYYTSESKNKYILLDEALFSVKLCKWFEHNIDKLEKALVSGF